MSSKDDPVSMSKNGLVSSQRMNQCQVKTKVYLVEPQEPRLPTKVSFKGGSHLGNPKPTFFLASPISGTRFLLRVVVCNIPRFYQILGEFFFCFCFVCVDWKIHRDLKLLSLFKNFILKLFQSFYYFMKKPLWEKPRIKILFSYFYSTSCKLACKGLFYKIALFNTGWFFKTKIECGSQLLFYKLLFYYF
jgi:hypothetical protein